jgi:modification methylase
MRPVWSDIRGASLRDGHPAPFPLELAERLIKTFSFAGDRILDPFAGSGSTAVAAIRAGRNSISVEIEEDYLKWATRRAEREAINQRLANASSHGLVFSAPVAAQIKASVEAFRAKAVVTLAYSAKHDEGYDR